MKKTHNIEVIAESPRDAYIQAFLARGDKQAGEVLWQAHQNGGSKAMKSVLKAQGTKLEDYVSQPLPIDELLPWEVLDMGFTREYLLKELAEAKKPEPTHTIKCFDGCKRCGVCK